MRHQVKGRKLGRTAPHREATLSALSVALIKHHRIVTTVAKAKELRTYVEPLITRAKEDTSHNRRQVFSSLKNKEVVSHLFEEVAVKAKDRPGGYTRVVKLGYRPGDGAQTAVIELVDYNDIKPEDSSKKKRTRRAGKSTSTTSSSDKKKGDSKSDKKSDEKKAETKKADEKQEEEKQEEAKAEEQKADAKESEEQQSEAKAEEEKAEKKSDEKKTKAKKKEADKENADEEE